MFSPEEESFAAEFLRKNQVRPTAQHTERQLDHIESQIGKAQAGLTGEGAVQTFSYGVRDRRMPFTPEFQIKQAVDRKFINGMITTAKYLRRSLRNTNGKG